MVQRSTTDSMILLWAPGQNTITKLLFHYLLDAIKLYSLIIKFIFTPLTSEIYRIQIFNARLVIAFTLKITSTPTNIIY